MLRSSVDLPEPEGPRTTVTCPARPPGRRRAGPPACRRTCARRAPRPGRAGSARGRQRNGGHRVDLAGGARRGTRPAASVGRAAAAAASAAACARRRGRSSARRSTGSTVMTVVSTTYQIGGDEQHGQHPLVAAVDDADRVEQLAERQHVDDRGALEQADHLVDRRRHDRAHRLRAARCAVFCRRRGMPSEAAASSWPWSTDEDAGAHDLGRVRRLVQPEAEHRGAELVDRARASRRWRTTGRTGCRSPGAGTGRRGCTRAAAAGSAARSGTPRCSPSSPPASSGERLSRISASTVPRAKPRTAVISVSCMVVQTPRTIDSSVR